MKYKQAILDKICSVKEANDIIDQAASGVVITCKDCYENGHFSKLYYRCKLYKLITADDIGVSSRNKRKQFDSVKNDKRNAKRSRTEPPPEGSSVANEDVCTNCHQPGHKSARSPQCPNYTASKKDVFKENLGPGYQPFTRKLPIDQCVNEPYKNLFKSAAVSVSKDMREIVFRAKLFVNYYVLRHSEQQQGHIPHCIFKQGFWYSICQLVNAKRITNNNNIPNDLLGIWDSFKTNHAQIVYEKKVQAGGPQCITEVSVELATTYQKSIVENFDRHLIKFIDVVHKV